MYPSKSKRQRLSFAIKFSTSLISHIGSSSFSSATISPCSFRRIWLSAFLISSSLARRNLVAKPKNCKRRMIHFVGSQSVNEGPDRKSWGNACWNLNCSLDWRPHHFECTDMLGWSVNFGQSNFIMIHLQNYDSPRHTSKPPVSEEFNSLFVGTGAQDKPYFLLMYFRLSRAANPSNEQVYLKSESHISYDDKVHTNSRGKCSARLKNMSHISGIRQLAIWTYRKHGQPVLPR